MIIVLIVLLTALSLAALLLPLWRKPSADPARGDFDAKIYRDQLAEIERDLERGLLNDSQAAAVRTEVQRRLLAALDRAEQPAAAPPRRWATILPLLLVVPLAAGVLYWRIGNAPMPDKPFATRQADPEFQMTAMADRLARSLESQPSAEGFATLAATYIHLKRYEEAADSYRRAIRMGAIDGDVLSSLGESLVMADDGTVGPEARQAFMHALMLEGADPRARFYLGLADAQVGRYADAVAVWKHLERDSAADAPWLPMLREHISEYAKLAGVDPATIAPKPPAGLGGGAAAPAAPAALPPVGGNPAAAAIMAQSPEERARTIRSMVDGLAARLEQNPNDKEGWKRLAGAYRVLGELDKAKAAEARATALP
jgi:cytochrome c-type biogenesis protein CcmH